MIAQTVIKLQIRIFVGESKITTEALQTITVIPAQAGIPSIRSGN